MDGYDGELWTLVNQNATNAAPNDFYSKYLHLSCQRNNKMMKYGSKAVWFNAQ